MLCKIVFFNAVMASFFPDKYEFTKKLLYSYFFCFLREG